MIVKAATWYQRRGLSVFPICPEKKIPLVAWTPYQTRAATPEEKNRWFKQWPTANLGMACGEVWDITVVDCDTQKAIEKIEEYLSDSLELPMVLTPKNGRHYYFSHTPGLKNWVGVFPGVDIRTTGGLVLLPPSKKGNKQYRWFDGLAIHQAQRPPMPEKLLSAILKSTNKKEPNYKVRKTEPGAYGAAALASEVASLARTPKSERNATLNRAAYSLGQLVAGGELDAGQVECALSAVALSIGLTPKETAATIQSGLAAGAATPRKGKSVENHKRNPQDGSTKKKRARVQFI